MDATSVADPAQVEPGSSQEQPEVAQTPEEKVRFGAELSEFLAATAEMYRQTGNAEKAAEIQMASEELNEPNMHSAAIAEVYLYASAWQGQLRMTHETEADDQNYEKYYRSRQIFMENCQAIFPYPREIDPDNIGSELQSMEDLLVKMCPSLPMLEGRLKPVNISEKAGQLENNPEAILAAIDDISSAVSVSVEAGLKNAAKDGFMPEIQGQLNTCIEQMYRLELLRNVLERQVRRTGGAFPSEQAPAEEVKPVDLAKEQSLEALKARVEANYERIGLKDHFEGLTLDEWIAEDLARDPNTDIFKDDKNGEDLGKWRKLERGIDGVRQWLTGLSPEEKPNRYRDLLENLDDVLSSF